MTRVAGVDGCRGGWLVVTAGVEAGSPASIELAPRIEPVIRRVERGELAVVAVDMPMGLPDSGRRSSDAEARRRLGARASTIFPTPPRAVLAARDWADALRLCRLATGRGLSKQAFNLVPRIAELDAALSPSRQAAVVEAHPELSFAALAGEVVAAPKRTRTGIEARTRLAGQVLPDVGGLLAGRPAGAAADDVLDAAILVWTARRVATGTAEWLGLEDGTDARGLRMVVAV